MEKDSNDPGYDSQDSGSGKDSPDPQPVDPSSLAPRVAVIQISPAASRGGSRGGSSTPSSGRGRVTTGSRGGRTSVPPPSRDHGIEPTGSEEEDCQVIQVNPNAGRGGSRGGGASARGGANRAPRSRGNATSGRGGRTSRPAPQNPDNPLEGQLGGEANSTARNVRVIGEVIEIAGPPSTTTGTTTGPIARIGTNRARRARSHTMGRGRGRGTRPPVNPDNPLEGQLGGEANGTNDNEDVQMIKADPTSAEVGGRGASNGVSRTRGISRGTRGGRQARPPANPDNPLEGQLGVEANGTTDNENVEVIEVDSDSSGVEVNEIDPNSSGLRTRGASRRARGGSNLASRSRGNARDPRGSRSTSAPANPDNPLFGQLGGAEDGTTGHEGPDVELIEDPPASGQNEAAVPAPAPIAPINPEEAYRDPGTWQDRISHVEELPAHLRTGISWGRSVEHQRGRLERIRNPNEEPATIEWNKRTIEKWNEREERRRAHSLSRLIKRIPPLEAAPNAPGAFRFVFGKPNATQLSMRLWDANDIPHNIAPNIARLYGMPVPPQPADGGIVPTETEASQAGASSASPSAPVESLKDGSAEPAAGQAEGSAGSSDAPSNGQVQVPSVDSNERSADTVAGQAEGSADSSDAPSAALPHERADVSNEGGAEPTAGQAEGSAGSSDAPSAGDPPERADASNEGGAEPAAGQEATASSASSATAPLPQAPRQGRTPVFPQPPPEVSPSDEEMHAYNVAHHQKTKGQSGVSPEENKRLLRERLARLRQQKSLSSNEGSAETVTGQKMRRLAIANLLRPLPLSKPVHAIAVNCHLENVLRNGPGQIPRRVNADANGTTNGVSAEEIMRLLKISVEDFLAWMKKRRTSLFLPAQNQSRVINPAGSSADPIVNDQQPASSIAADADATPGPPGAGPSGEAVEDNDDMEDDPDFVDGPTIWDNERKGGKYFGIQSDTQMGPNGTRIEKQVWLPRSTSTDEPSEPKESSQEPVNETDEQMTSGQPQAAIESGPEEESEEPEPKKRTIVLGHVSGDEEDDDDEDEYYKRDRERKERFDRERLEKQRALKQEKEKHEKDMVEEEKRKKKETERNRLKRDREWERKRLAEEGEQPAVVQPRPTQPQPIPGLLMEEMIQELARRTTHPDVLLVGLKNLPFPAFEATRVAVDKLRLAHLAGEEIPITRDQLMVIVEQFKLALDHRNGITGAAPMAPLPHGRDQQMVQEPQSEARPHAGGLRESGANPKVPPEEKENREKRPMEAPRVIARLVDLDAGKDVFDADILEAARREAARQPAVVTAFPIQPQGPGRSTTVFTQAALREMKKREAQERARARQAQMPPPLNISAGEAQMMGAQRLGELAELRMGVIVPETHRGGRGASASTPYLQQLPPNIIPHRIARLDRAPRSPASHASANSYRGSLEPASPLGSQPSSPTLPIPRPVPRNAQAPPRSGTSSLSPQRGVPQLPLARGAATSLSPQRPVTVIRTTMAHSEPRRTVIAGSMSRGAQMQQVPPSPVRPNQTTAQERAIRQHVPGSLPRDERAVSPSDLLEPVSPVPSSVPAAAPTPSMQRAMIGRPPAKSLRTHQPQGAISRRQREPLEERVQEMRTPSPILRPSNGNGHRNEEWSARTTSDHDATETEDCDVKAPATNANVAKKLKQIYGAAGDPISNERIDGMLKDPDVADLEPIRIPGKNGAPDEFVTPRRRRHDIPRSPGDEPEIIGIEEASRPAPTPYHYVMTKREKQEAREIVRRKRERRRNIYAILNIPVPKGRPKNDEDEYLEEEMWKYLRTSKDEKLKAIVRAELARANKEHGKNGVDEDDHVEEDDGGDGDLSRTSVDDYHDDDGQNGFRSREDVGLAVREDHPEDDEDRKRRKKEREDRRRAEEKRKKEERLYQDDLCPKRVKVKKPRSRASSVPEEDDELREFYANAAAKYHGRRRTFQDDHTAVIDEVEALEFYEYLPPQTPRSSNPSSRASSVDDRAPSAAPSGDVENDEDDDGEWIPCKTLAPEDRAKVESGEWKVNKKGKIVKKGKTPPPMPDPSSPSEKARQARIDMLKNIQPRPSNGDDSARRSEPRRTACRVKDSPPSSDDDDSDDSDDSDDGSWGPHDDDFTLGGGDPMDSMDASGPALDDEVFDMGGASSPQVVQEPAMPEGHVDEGIFVRLSKPLEEYSEDDIRKTRIELEKEVLEGHLRDARYKKGALIEEERDEFAEMLENFDRERHLNHALDRHLDGKSGAMVLKDPVDLAKKGRRMPDYLVKRANWDEYQAERDGKHRELINLRTQIECLEVLCSFRDRHKGTSFKGGEQLKKALTASYPTLLESLSTYGKLVVEELLSSTHCYDHLFDYVAKGTEKAYRSSIQGRDKEITRKIRFLIDHAPPQPEVVQAERTKERQIRKLQKMGLRKGKKVGEARDEEDSDRDSGDDDYEIESSDHVGGEMAVGSRPINEGLDITINNTVDPPKFKETDGEQRMTLVSTPAAVHDYWNIPPLIAPHPAGMDELTKEPAVKRRAVDWVNGLKQKEMRFDPSVRMGEEVDGTFNRLLTLDPVTHFQPETKGRGGLGEYLKRAMDKNAFNQRNAHVEDTYAGVTETVDFGGIQIEKTDWLKPAIMEQLQEEDYKYHREEIEERREESTSKEDIEKLVEREKERIAKEEEKIINRSEPRIIYEKEGSTIYEDIEEFIVERKARTIKDDIEEIIERKTERTADLKEIIKSGKFPFFEAENCDRANAYISEYLQKVTYYGSHLEYVSNIVDFQEEELAIFMAYRYYMLQATECMKVVQLLFRMNEAVPSRDDFSSEADYYYNKAISVIHRQIGAAIKIAIKKAHIRFFDSSNRRFHGLDKEEKEEGERFDGKLFKLIKEDIEKLMIIVSAIKDNLDQFYVKETQMHYRYLRHKAEIEGDYMDSVDFEDQSGREEHIIWQGLHKLKNLKMDVDLIAAPKVVTDEGFTNIEVLISHSKNDEHLRREQCFLPEKKKTVLILKNACNEKVVRALSEYCSDGLKEQLEELKARDEERLAVIKEIESVAKPPSSLPFFNLEPSIYISSNQEHTQVTLSVARRIFDEFAPDGRPYNASAEYRRLLIEREQKMAEENTDTSGTPSPPPRALSPLFEDHFEDHVEQPSFDQPSSPCAPSSPAPAQAPASPTRSEYADEDEDRPRMDLNPAREKEKEKSEQPVSRDDLLREKRKELKEHVKKIAQWKKAKNAIDKELEETPFVAANWEAKVRTIRQYKGPTLGVRSHREDVPTEGDRMDLQDRRINPEKPKIAFASDFEESMQKAITRQDVRQLFPSVREHIISKADFGCFPSGHIVAEESHSTASATKFNHSQETQMIPNYNLGYFGWDAKRKKQSIYRKFDEEEERVIDKTNFTVEHTGYSSCVVVPRLPLNCSMQAEVEVGDSKKKNEFAYDPMDVHEAMWRRRQSPPPARLHPSFEVVDEPDDEDERQFREKEAEKEKKKNKKKVPDYTVHTKRELRKGYLLLDHERIQEREAREALQGALYPHLKMSQLFKDQEDAPSTSKNEGKQEPQHGYIHTDEDKIAENREIEQSKKELEEKKIEDILQFAIDASMPREIIKLNESSDGPEAKRPRLDDDAQAGPSTSNGGPSMSTSTSLPQSRGKRIYEERKSSFNKKKTKYEYTATEWEEKFKERPEKKMKAIYADEAAMKLGEQWNARFGHDNILELEPPPMVNAEDLPACHQLFTDAIVAGEPAGRPRIRSSIVHPTTPAERRIVPRQPTGADQPFPFRQSTKEDVAEKNNQKNEAKEKRDPYI